MKLLFGYCLHVVYFLQLFVIGSASTKYEFRKKHWLPKDLIAYADFVYIRFAKHPLYNRSYNIIIEEIF